MNSQINRALNARLAARKSDKGFTLIELLVVVIIIGILAAIAIPVYLGIQNNAKDSATKSDLTNFKVNVVAAQTLANGTLPLTQGTSGVPTSTSGSTTVSYKSTPAGSTTPTGFCISATSGSGAIFQITDATSVLTGTAC